jgi:hypothetical protein
LTFLYLLLEGAHPTRICILAGSNSKFGFEFALQMKRAQMNKLRKVVERKRLIEMLFDVAANFLRHPRFTLQRLTSQTGPEAGFTSKVGIREELHAFAPWPSAGASRTAENATGEDCINERAIHRRIPFLDRLPIQLFLCRFHIKASFHSLTPNR